MLMMPYYTLVILQILLYFTMHIEFLHYIPIVVCVWKISSYLRKRKKIMRTESQMKEETKLTQKESLKNGSRYVSPRQ